MKNGVSGTIAAISAVLVFACNGVAADIRDQTDVQIGKAELVIPDGSPQEVAKQVKEAISQWSIPASASFRGLPSTIPARPDEPVTAQVNVGGTLAMSYKCSTAFAVIAKNPPPVKNAFAYIAEETQACVYPFQRGVKVYLFQTRLKKMESLTSGLFGGITKAIQGSDDERITGQLNENIEAIRKVLPSLLVEKIEVPGVPVQEPDKAAVAAIIPAKIETPALAAQPAAPATSVAASQSPMQAKIEARKNLTAMGLQYHSQEQFVAAIRRRDDVAVQLYLDAGGLDLSAKDSGKTFEAIAKDAGATEIAAMIAAKTASPVPAPQVGADSGKARAAEPLAPLSVADKTAILDRVHASLSPGAQSQVELALADLPANVPPEQRQTVRAQILSLHTSLRKFTDRIDPETGNLR